MTAHEPPVGVFHRIDHRSIWLHTSGKGGPTAVFLPGAGAVGLDYWSAHRHVARFTTSVLYDRAGTGWSDRGTSAARTPHEITGELSSLLEAASLPGPYVLVGHSLGADYARFFADRFPGRTAGIVMIEPHHEDLTASLPPELAQIYASFPSNVTLPDEIPTEVTELYRSLFTQEMADWPEGIRTPLAEAHVSRDWLQTGLVEAAAARALCESLRALGPLPRVPLVILTATDVDPFKQAVSRMIPQALLRGEIEGKTRLYDRLAASVPHGENRLIANTGHVTLPMRRPDAIARAVLDVIEHSPC